MGNETLESTTTTNYRQARAALAGDAAVRRLSSTGTEKPVAASNNYVSIELFLFHRVLIIDHIRLFRKIQWKRHVKKVI